MKKILTVIGARPQFIKASVVSRVISRRPDLEEVVVHTGQHYDVNMSNVFFSELGMTAPDYNLEIAGGGHGEMTGRMLVELERVMLLEKPSLVLVYGDTNSTLAGALAAAKLHVPVAHVEAGLRSSNMRMPEEINRILTDRLSSWLFAPTEAAVEHLRSEGIVNERIFPVGDVMYEVALHYGAKLEPDGDVFEALNLAPKAYVLTTVHRAENTDDFRRLGVIVEAMNELSKAIDVVWPLHPRARRVLEASGLLGLLSKRVHALDPVGYLDMVRLEKYAALVATDSGGVQKEAFFHGVPCVTLRAETEWVELVAAGWNRLAPPLDARSIVATVHSTIGSRGAEITPYGDADAAQKIVWTLGS